MLGERQDQCCTLLLEFGKHGRLQQLSVKEGLKMKLGIKDSWQICSIDGQHCMPCTGKMS